MVHSVTLLLPVQSHRGGDNPVPDVMEVLRKPDVDRPGREPTILLHAARLLAREDIKTVTVTARDRLFDVDDHAVVIDGNLSDFRLFVGGQSSERTQRALFPAGFTRHETVFIPITSSVSPSTNFRR